jgi:hypothetical protein
VIYLDSSVVLARLFAETRQLPDRVWHLELASSRLLQYEVWNRLHARHIPDAVAQHAHHLLGRVQMIDLIPDILERALHPFPVVVRALDGLHLATIEYLRKRDTTVELASFDARMITASRAMDVALYTP